MVAPVLWNWLGVEVYVITIAFTTCTLSQSAIFKGNYINFLVPRNCFALNSCKHILID